LRLGVGNWLICSGETFVAVSVVRVSATADAATTVTPPSVVATWPRRRSSEST
jgi:hypothetical protein